MSAALPWKSSCCMITGFCRNTSRPCRLGSLTNKGVHHIIRRNRMDKRRKFRSPLKYEKKTSFANYAEEIDWIMGDQLTSPSTAQHSKPPVKSNAMHQRSKTMSPARLLCKRWPKTARIGWKWISRLHISSRVHPSMETSEMPPTMFPTRLRSQSSAKLYGRKYNDRLMPGKAPRGTKAASPAVPPLPPPCRRRRHLV